MTTTPPVPQSPADTDEGAPRRCSRGGRATTTSVNATLIAIFKARLEEACLTLDGRDSTALSIARDVVRHFPVAERRKAARLLGLVPLPPVEGEQLDLEGWLDGRDCRGRA